MALWRDELVDIVVTDIFMSENDGFEVIQEMKKVARTPKIIAMSGGGQRGLFDWNLAALSLWADRNTPFLVQVSTIRTVEQGLAVLTRRQHSEAMMQERRDHRYGGGPGLVGLAQGENPLLTVTLLAFRLGRNFRERWSTSS